MSLYARLATLQDILLGPAPDSAKIAAVLPTDQNAWMVFFQFAETQKVLPLLTYAAAEIPAFQAAIGAEECAILKQWNEAHMARTERMRGQVLELADHYVAKGMRLMLLKGSNRYFDTVYPAPHIRFAADLDLLITEKAPYFAAMEIGYQPDEEVTPILDGSSESLERAMSARGIHHYPSLVREGEQAQIELHIRPYYGELMRFDNKRLWDDAMAVDGHPALFAPHKRDQVLISLLHLLYHSDAFALYALSLRNLDETRRLYLALSDADKTWVAAQFKRRADKSRFETWRAVCQQLYGVDMGVSAITSGHKAFVAELCRTAENPDQLKSRKRLEKVKKSVRKLWYNPIAYRKQIVAYFK